MTRRSAKNVAASVRQRLLDLARQRGEDFQLVLSRFAIERLLHRLDQSPHRDRFVVKGALLFHLWTEQPYRPTRDIDFLAHGDPAVPSLEAVFRDVCDRPVEADGLVFQSNTVVGQGLKSEHEYPGVRIRLVAKLERARIPVQIDLGFGDAVFPEPRRVVYPSMLGFPTPAIWTYPKEAVVAEKFQVLVTFGMVNTRLKDYFDLWVLTEYFEFDSASLATAIHATFERRRTPLPTTVPTGLAAEFSADRAKQAQWNALVARTGLTNAPSLAEVVARLRAFLIPPTEAARLQVPVRERWLPPGPWQA